MHNDLINALRAKGYWFKEVNGMFLLNVGDPAVPLNSTNNGPGTLMRVQALKFEVLARWTDEDHGYDETWEFESVPNFMAFLDAFLEDGVDAATNAA